MEQEKQEKIKKEPREKQKKEIPPFLSAIGGWFKENWPAVLKWTGIVLAAMVGVCIVVVMIGSAINPDFIKTKYEIESMSDWEKLTEEDPKGPIFGYVSSTFHKEIVLMTDLDFSGKTYKTPNLSSLNFDGNGHTIKNVKLEVGESLLGYTSQIVNINFENVVLESYEKDNNISLFSHADYFKNVYVSGEIYAPYSESVAVFTTRDIQSSDYPITFIDCKTNVNIQGGKIAGGFVGWSTANFTFTNCQNEGDISAKEYAGGIFGKAITSDEYKNIDSTVQFVFENNTNNGKISSKGCAGGIAGYPINTKMKGCKNNGVITGVKNIGGLVGALDGEIISSVNNASVTAVDSSETQIANLGGVVGIQFEKSTVVDCYNNGELNNPYYVTGGIVGNCYGVVAGCINNGLINGGDCAGGIVGYIGDKTDPWRFKDATIRIAHCTNNARVSANSFAGGIIGIADLNKADKDTQNAAWMITTFVDDFVDINNEISIIDVDIKKYLPDIFDFTDEVLSLLTRATKLELAYCVSRGDIDATYYSGGLVGIMFASSVEEEELETNEFDAIITCPNVSSEGYNYVDAADISRLK